MNVGILYLKADNTIHLFSNDVVEVTPTSLICKDDIFRDFDENIVGVLVVDSLVYLEEVSEEKSEYRPMINRYLVDEEGNKYSYGDKVPDGLVNLKDYYQKKTFDDLVKENIILKQELANTNAMMLEFMETILN